MTIDGEDVRDPMGGAAAGSGGGQTDRLTAVVLAIILIGAIQLQRFGVLIGDASIGANLFVTLAGVAVLWLFGRIELNFVRLVLFMLTVATMALVTAAGPKMLSLNSFLLLLVLYACFVFQLAPDRIDYLRVLRLFQNLVLICSIAGILQFAGQFVLPGPLLFTWEWWLPEQFMNGGKLGYNTVIPLYWGAKLYKSNGFFLVEPSTFSQLSAIAIVIELLFFERKWRTALYASGMLLSYSGTGLVLLALALPVIFIMRRQFWLIWIGLLGVAVVAVYGEVLNVDVFTRRLEEFGSPRTSGFARYIGPWWLLGQHIVGDATTVLVGRGPGSIMAYLRNASYEVHDPTWAKLIFEYGLIGFAVFMTFFLYCLFAASPSRFMALALLFGYMTFGGMLLNTQYHALLLVLGMLPLREATGRAGVPAGGLAPPAPAAPGRAEFAFGGGYAAHPGGGHPGPAGWRTVEGDRTALGPGGPSPSPARPPFTAPVMAPGAEGGPSPGNDGPRFGRDGHAPDPKPSA
ncbi:MAG TPA: hypothetical protein VFG47_22835 [Geminicoccaceae bacterium]|nr:hypothetical protein [Geminicoccaceae bacterium]